MLNKCRTLTLSRFNHGCVFDIGLLTIGSFMTLSVNQIYKLVRNMFIHPFFLRLFDNLITRIPITITLFWSTKMFWINPIFLGETLQLVRRIGETAYEYEKVISKAKELSLCHKIKCYYPSIFAI